jgi:hypothetical protein
MSQPIVAKQVTQEEYNQKIAKASQNPQTPAAPVPRQPTLEEAHKMVDDLRRQELADTREALGDAEGKLHLEKQKNAVNQNLIADLADLFKMNNRWGVSLKGLLMSFIDQFWLKAGTIDNFHRVIHQRKYPPWYVFAGLGMIFVPLVAILAYPPYAIGFSNWLTSPPSNGYILFAIVFLVLIIFLVRSFRRGTPRA